LATNIEQIRPETASRPPSGPLREAVKSVPVIDLSPFMSAGQATHKDAVAQDLRKACIDVGFFYLTGHELPAGELDEAVAVTLRFFQMPLDVKLKYRATRAGGTGFVRVGGLNPDQTAEESADIKERFIVVRGTSVRQDDAACWPDDETVPGFSSFMQRHIERRVRIAKALARAFAMSLKLPEGYFDPYYEKMSHNMLLNYYPPLTEAAVKRSQWSFSPHTDYGGFTLLSQDSIGGLQVQNSAGEWIDVPPRDNHFVVNIGDLTAMWTNDLYKSTLHRAANVSGNARVSIPLFASPNRASVLETLPTCVSGDNPSRYAPVTAGDYLDKLIEKTDTTGKPGLSDSTTKRLS
jgi:isopenicillin N synthase-like dioxygenase